MIQGFIFGDTGVLGALAQLGERCLCKAEVTGSSPVCSIKIQAHCLLGDTLHLFRVLRGGKTHWPGRLPGRARALASYVKACLSGRVVHLDLIRGDFRPFFARIVSFLVERKGT